MNSVGLSILIFFALVIAVGSIVIFHLYSRLRRSVTHLQSIRASFEAKLARAMEVSAAFEKEIVGYWRFNITQMHKPLDHVKYQDIFFESPHVKSLCYNYYQQSLLVRMLEIITGDLSSFGSAKGNASQITQRLLDAYTTVISNHEIEVFKALDPHANVAIAPPLLEKLLNYLLFTAMKHPQKGKKLIIEIACRKGFCEIEVFFVGKYENIQLKHIKHFSQIDAAVPDKICALAMNKIVDAMNGQLVATRLDPFSMIGIKLPLASDDAKIDSAYSINYEEIQREVSLLNAIDLTATSSQVSTSNSTKPSLLIFTRQQAQFEILEEKLGDVFRIETSLITTDTPNELDFADTLPYLERAKASMPDIIFIDYCGDDNKDSLCLALQDELLTSHIPIFLLVNDKDIKSQAETRANGKRLISLSRLSIAMPPDELSSLVHQQLIRGQKIKAAWHHATRAGDAATSESEAPLPTMPIDEKSMAFLSAVDQHLEYHFGDPGLSSEHVAIALSMEPNDFERKFGSLTFHTAQDYIRSVRLCKARNFILEGESLSGLFERVGYTNENIFTREFTDHFELAPNDLAESLALTIKAEAAQKQLT